MRILAAFISCTALLGSSAVAQDFGFADGASGGDPYSLEAATQGPTLPRIREFRVDYAQRSAAFEAPLPQVQPDAWKPPEPDWFDPSLQIAGAKVKPDIKHKGLKVAFQIWDADDVNEDEPN